MVRMLPTAFAGSRAGLGPKTAYNALYLRECHNIPEQCAYGSRRILYTQAQSNSKSSKGFGEPPKKANEIPPRPVEAAKSLLKLEKSGKERKRPDQARPVDPQEAAKGRVDVVQVKDWGSGNPEDLGALQVESTSLAYAAKDDRPLYEQLGRALEMAQARGLMKIADGGAPPPPFERWSFREGRYRQYLADIASVHQALEDAIATVTATAPPPATAAGGESGAAPADPVALLRRFTVAAGLHRSEQIRRDIAALVTTSAHADSQSPTASRQTDRADAVQAQDTTTPSHETAAGGGVERPPQTPAANPTASPASSSSSAAAVQTTTTAPAATAATAAAAAVQTATTAPVVAAAPAAATAAAEPAAAAAGIPAHLPRSAAGDAEAGLTAPRPTQMASAYAAYISRLATDCTTAPTAQEAALAAARLLAHIYSLHASHLITGTRIGAAAVEKLHLLQRRAFNLYNTYPSDVPNPAKTFVRNINASGLALMPSAREALFEELPRGWQKTCLLMSALAHTN